MVSSNEVLISTAPRGMKAENLNLCSSRNDRSLKAASPIQRLIFRVALITRSPLSLPLTQATHDLLSICVT